jgi:hypothetical protein
MGFSFYTACTIQTGQVPSSQSGFPALVPFLAADSNYATVANGGRALNSSGFDIRPYSDAALTTALTFQLISYTASTGVFEMWVNMTAVDGGVVYMAVGNPALTTDGSSTSTWDSNFYGVYHGQTLTADSSQSANTLTNHNTVTSGTGQISSCGSYARASTQYLDKTGMAQPAAITMSAWINSTSLAGAYNTVMSSQDVGASTYAALHIKSTGKMAVYVQSTTNPGTVAFDPGSHTTTTGTWFHVAATYSTSAGLVGYVNGASDGTFAANGIIPAGTVITTIGRDPTTSGREWNGLIDEVHFSNIARSANWIQTEYNNQVNLGTFWSKGSLVGLPTYPKLERQIRGLFRGLYSQ